MKPLTNITTTNLELVAPTIDCSVAKKLNRQLERGGGVYPNASFNFEMYDKAVGVNVCLSAKRANDCIVYRLPRYAIRNVYGGASERDS